MSKQDILDYFSDINYAYNDSTRLDTLSRMLDELVEQTAAERWVRCEDEMPKEMNVVVTYGKGRVSFGYCMFLYDADMEKDVCEWVDTHSNRMEVTHWMPLPEPPREG